MPDAGAARRGARGTVLAAAGLFVFFFVCFNANGREIATADSHAAKFASVMLARRGALTLDGVVGRQPLYGDRMAFTRDREGHWRNSYPLPPVLEAAGVASALRALRILALDAPLSPQIVSKVTASLLASLAGMLAFVTARRFATTGQAALVAVGFSLGTGLWPTASQTLWQHATSIWSLMAAIAVWTAQRSQATRHASAASVVDSRPERVERVEGRLLRRRSWQAGAARFAVIGALLGWSLSARPQTLPLVGILAAGMMFDATWRQRAALTAALLAPVAVFAGLNVMWFGHPAGGIPQFERLNMSIHNTIGTWQSPLAGISGLLASPSRGLLIFSPIVLVVLFARAAPPHRPILWWTLAAAGAQLLLYGMYAVWWGGYTYGPRYVLDLLPALVPAAAMGVSRLGGSSWPLRAVAGAALAWSIAAAATGAFCYPHDEWNTDPVNLDRAHERLWAVRDSQIPRCWSRGLAPENFVLFDRALWRR